jgi:hypothetical protein
MGQGILIHGGALAGWRLGRRLDDDAKNDGDHLNN